MDDKFEEIEEYMLWQTNRNPGYVLMTLGQHLGVEEGDCRNPYLYPSAQNQGVVNF